MSSLRLSNVDSQWCYPESELSEERQGTRQRREGDRRRQGSGVGCASNQSALQAHTEMSHESHCFVQSARTSLTSEESKWRLTCVASWPHGSDETATSMNLTLSLLAILGFRPHLLTMTTLSAVPTQSRPLLQSHHTARNCSQCAFVGPSKVLLLFPLVTLVSGSSWRTTSVIQSYHGAFSQCWELMWVLRRKRTERRRALELRCSIPQVP